MAVKPVLVDCHAHIDLLKDPEKAIARARSNDIGTMIAVGIDINSSRKAVEYAGRFPEIYAAVGIHPHDAASLDDNALDTLALISSSEKVVAIGETGLDFYRNLSPRDVQKEAFIQQIELAREKKMPLIVHTREAAEDTLKILGKHAAGITIILHCFSLYEHIDLCAERGYNMSIAGNVTYPKAEGLRNTVLKIPANQLLTETDAPYLAPVPFRGKMNEPANVELVVKELAKLRGEDISDLKRLLFQNFLRAFRQE